MNTQFSKLPAVIIKDCKVIENQKLYMNIARDTMFIHALTEKEFKLSKQSCETFVEVSETFVKNHLQSYRAGIVVTRAARNLMGIA